ncbi:sterol desaturase family protein [Ilumatobacter coccineus]|uniref:sterol desaturase family protein n=1 Tax=Ilumatobacter coccineus TaxID=467094 RepID=UPI0009FF3499|nr:sterol desaturase family protein [Ilumatobacter coccineus]
MTITFSTSTSTSTSPSSPERSSSPTSGPRPSRVRRWLAPGLALALIGVSIALDLGTLVIIPLLFVLIVPFEKLFPRHRQRVRRPQLGTDMSHALAAPALNVVGLAVAIVVGVVSLAWLPGLLIRPLVSMIPSVALPFVGIALFDMAIYWVHRWSHEVPVLWRFHAVHHSTETLDWISGLRNHPLDGAIVAPPFFFLIAAGFSAQFTGALAAIQLLLGLFLHANVRWRLRPLHRVVITPEFHHWHHANETDAHNSNYSVFLPLWDIVFGTYYMPRNKRPLVYGISEHMPDGLVAQLRHPLRGTGNPLRLFRHPVRSLRSGWRFTRTLARDVWHSTTRPRTRRPAAGEPCRWAAAAPSSDAR